LFIHRDAENDPIEQRTKEIDKAVYAISNSEELHNKVYIIPVRMQEAWLLIDENAIRKASGNSSGSINLQMPALQKLETIPDPKVLLYKLLIDASELSGRRLDKFKRSIRRRSRRISDFINDFSPLLNLEAFQVFDTELKKFSEQWQRI